MLTGRVSKREWLPGRFLRRGLTSSTQIRIRTTSQNRHSKRRRQKRKPFKRKLSSSSLTWTNLSLPSMEVVERDPDRPCFHVMPVKGWLNDPNGPIYYRGRYHLFYQHVKDRVEWDWGLVWAHAVSEDLVCWEHLPIALEPSVHGMDADGCFSGCSCVSRDGIPTLLYTGVRLRSNFGAELKLPPAEFDLQLPFIETQLAAVADPQDDWLKTFKKIEKPVIALPPRGLGLAGWRDPFVVKEGVEGRQLMLIGSGIKGKGGTVLKYLAEDVLDEWTFAGQLCTGDADTGAMWECPILVKLKQQQDLKTGIQTIVEEGSNSDLNDSGKCSEMQDLQSDLQNLKLRENGEYLFCVSPDAPTNPVICWLGHYNKEEQVFDKAESQGPFRLDLGDILYAPNITDTPEGDTLLWGWLQEKRQVGSYDYSGCLSVPRRLTSRSGRLFQEPINQLKKLRTGNCWELDRVPLFPEEPIPIEELNGQSLDIQVKMEKGTSEAVGLLIRSWRVGGEGTAAVVFDWETSTLEVVFEALDPETMEFYLDSNESRRIGGPIAWELGQPLELRILLDHSTLEIFTGSGEVLSTRVYRGAPLPEEDSGIDLISYRGVADLISVSVHEMNSIWKEDESFSTVIKNIQSSKFSLESNQMDLHSSSKASTNQI